MIIVYNLTNAIVVEIFLSSDPFNNSLKTVNSGIFKLLALLLTKSIFLKEIPDSQIEISFLKENHIYEIEPSTYPAAPLGQTPL